jgi:hypothetical protein
VEKHGFAASSTAKAIFGIVANVTGNAETDH